MDPHDLPVGDALDALVATRVCRWEDVQYVPELVAYYGWMPDATLEDNRARVPQFSTELVWAWSVVAALREEGLLPAFLRELAQHYQAAGTPPDAYQILDAFFADRWAPRTICRVALRVVGKP